MARAQLIVLGDFVDFDIGFDADFLPHADDGLDHFEIFRLESFGGLDSELYPLGTRVTGFF